MARWFRWLSAHERLFWWTLAVGLWGGVTLLGGLMCATYDTGFHVMRLAALAYELPRVGYPVRLYSAVCDGFGYASPLFYCDLFLLPFAALRLLGVPMAMCYGLMMALLPSLMVGMSAGVARWFGLERKACALFALGYAFAPTMLQCHFAYNQVGVMLAATFLPCVVLPALVVCTEVNPSGRRLRQAGAWLTMGMTAILCAHVISSVLVTLFLATLCLVRMRTLLREPRRLGVFAVAAVVTLGLTAWFWLPFVEQTLALETAVMERGGTGGRSLWRYFARPWGLFLSPFLVNRIVGFLGLPLWLRLPEDTFVGWGWFLLPMGWCG